MVEIETALFWPVVSGAATAAIVTAVSFWVTILLRGRTYSASETAEPKIGFQVPALPLAVRTASEAAEDEAEVQFFMDDHLIAMKLQNRCVAYLVAASATLCAAFIITAATATVLKDVEILHLFSAAADVTALALVFWAFRRATALRNAWIYQRSVAEILRQWAETDRVLFPGPETYAERRAAFVARIKTALVPTHGAGLLTAVKRLGDERIAEIRTGVAAQPGIPVDRLKRYLARRPIRQARWFALSFQRIENQQERRGKLMVLLFTIAGAAALTKFVALLVAPHGAHFMAQFAMFVLLVAIGFAAASTSSYLGQNLRSLRHRYSTQLRSFELWFAMHATTVARARSAGPVSSRHVATTARAVEAFESLMFVELLDWISISSNDAMELAPA